MHRLAQARLPPARLPRVRVLASADPTAPPADASPGGRTCTQPLGNSLWQSLSFMMDTGAMEDVVDSTPRLIAFGETLFGLFFVSVLISVGMLPAPPLAPSATHSPAKRRLHQPAA